MAILHNQLWTYETNASIMKPLNFKPLNLQLWRARSLQPFARWTEFFGYNKYLFLSYKSIATCFSNHKQHTEKHVWKGLSCCINILKPIQNGTISQTTFSNAFSYKFHWSFLDYRRIYTSFGLNEFIFPRFHYYKNSFIKEYPGVTLFNTFLVRFG